ncbi:MAG TPA: CHASE sensor domain-containing protein, partial [Thermoanaerobaculia bacterium]|nr:CHASE sensor domain-containing protein [Thermoanaerobaculia bacterium]
MRKRWTHMGLKNRLVLTAAAILFFVTLAVLTVAIRRQHEKMREYLQQKAQVVARIAAQTASVGLVFDDVDSVKSELKVVEVSPDVKLAAVYRQDGRLFAYYGESPAPYDSVAKGYFSRNDVQLAEVGNERLLVFAPILQEGKRLGTLMLGVSLESLNRDVRNSVLIGLLALVVALVVGSGVFYLLADRITASLAVAVEAANRVARGDLTTQIHVRG